MKSEFFLDLCFIRESASDASAQAFAQSIKEQLQSMFSEGAKWSLEQKKENDLDFVIVEVKGMGVWEKDDDLLAYMEQHASLEFLNGLQGYRVQIDVKEEHEECLHCGKNKVRAEVS